MSVLIYSYVPHPKKNPITKKIIGEEFYPLIPIRICYKHKLYPFSIDALIDSGSSRNLFPAHFGEKIGISLKKGKLKKILGIGNKVIKGYTHEISIYLGRNHYCTTADFSYEHDFILLGRRGFFHLFKNISFEENNRLVKITTKD